MDNNACWQMKSRKLLVNAINWRDAPIWAMYCAWDADGYFNWFSDKPVAVEFGKFWDAMDCKYQDDYRFHNLSVSNWRNSLQSRQLTIFEVL